jgi:CRP-like cAMP-binding protein
MPNLKLSPDLYKYLKGAATPIAKRRGTVLFHAGRPGRGAFLIRSGEVRMILGDKSKVYPARTLGSGSVIGLPATFSGEPYSLTAEVKKDCRLYFLPRRKLLDLLRRNPEVGFHIVRILSEEISQLRKAAGRVPKKARTPAGRAPRL